MDRYWYHVLLKGSVKHGAKIENQLKGKVPDIALGGTISEESGNVRILGFRMNSDKRLTSFYILGFMMLAIVFVCLFLAVPNRPPPVGVLGAGNTQPVQTPAPQQPAAPSK
jgi:hypothetical protein